MPGLAGHDEREIEFGGNEGRYTPAIITYLISTYSSMP
jgi:hypothetical protein